MSRCTALPHWAGLAASLTLLGLGAAGLVGFAWRRRNKPKQEATA